MDKLGGCNSPIAAYSNVEGDDTCLKGSILSLYGKILIRDKVESRTKENTDLGSLLADIILNNGGKELIKKIGFE